jgi:hypothetical protein
MDRIKCTACKRQKYVSDFLKNGKTLKTCVSCRAPKRSQSADTVNPFPVKIPITISPVMIPQVTIPEVIPEVIIPKIPLKPIVLESTGSPRWQVLSGKWIRVGEERKLHEILTKKLIREFKQRAAFSVHKYLTTWLMADIRDI